MSHPRIVCMTCMAAIERALSVLAEAFLVVHTLHHTWCCCSWSLWWFSSGMFQKSPFSVSAASAVMAATKRRRGGNIFHLDSGYKRFLTQISMIKAIVSYIICYIMIGRTLVWNLAGLTLFYFRLWFRLSSILSSNCKATSFIWSARNLDHHPQSTQFVSAQTGRQLFWCQMWKDKDKDTSGQSPIAAPI